MNKIRRKTLTGIYDQLAELKEKLEEINEAEQESFSNRPENFRESEDYEVAEEVANNLEEACSSFGDLMDYLENVITA